MGRASPVRRLLERATPGHGFALSRRKKLGFESLGCASFRPLPIQQIDRVRPHLHGYTPSNASSGELRLKTEQ
jgi:hypothetical protein